MVSTCALITALLCMPASGYVTPGAYQPHAVNKGTAQPAAVVEGASVVETDLVSGCTVDLSAIAAGLGLGAVIGWLSARRQQAASATVAAAVAMSPVAATAMVDYQDVQYLGGSDKVDINNATVQAYRQFPGMYPSAAGAICSHGPYNSVADIYNIPGLKDEVKAIIKKYEANLVCLPANPAYFLDRINNGMYR